MKDILLFEKQAVIDFSDLIYLHTNLFIPIFYFAIKTNSIRINNYMKTCIKRTNFNQRRNKHNNEQVDGLLK